MATEGRQDLWTVTAAADLSGSQYKLVTMAGAIAGAGARGFPLADTPVSGQSGAVVVAGITKVVAGAAVAAGAQVTSDASGRAVTASTTGHAVNGTALSAATGAGELLTLLVHGGIV